MLLSYQFKLSESDSYAYDCVTSAQIKNNFQALLRVRYHICEITKIIP